MGGHNLCDALPRHLHRSLRRGPAVVAYHTFLEVPRKPDVPLAGTGTAADEVDVEHGESPEGEHSAGNGADPTHGPTSPFGLRRAFFAKVAPGGLCSLWLVPECFGSRRGVPFVALAKNGGGGNRTRVRTCVNVSVYVRSPSFGIRRRSPRRAGCYRSLGGVGTLRTRPAGTYFEARCRRRGPPSRRSGARRLPN